MIGIVDIFLESKVKFKYYIILKICQYASKHQLIFHVFGDWRSFWQTYYLWIVEDKEEFDPMYGVGVKGQERKILQFCAFGKQHKLLLIFWKMKFIYGILIVFGFNVVLIVLSGSHFKPPCWLVKRSQAPSYQTFYILTSAEHEIYPAHKCKNANYCWHFNIH